MSVDWKLIRDSKLHTITAFCNVCGAPTPHNIVYGCMCCYEDKQAEQNKPEQPKRISKCTKNGCFTIPF